MSDALRFGLGYRAGPPPHPEHCPVCWHNHRGADHVEVRAVPHRPWFIGGPSKVPDEKRRAVLQTVFEAQP